MTASKTDQLLAKASPESVPETKGEVTGAAAAELMLGQVEENKKVAAASKPLDDPAAAAKKKAKSKEPAATEVDPELRAAQARIAELEAALAAQGQAPADPNEPPPGKVKVGEIVTFHHDSKLAVRRFPFRHAESHFVEGPNGRTVLAHKEPARAEARFQPHGLTNGGTYTTSDPQEIEYLVGLTKGDSPKFDPSLQVWSRKPIFEEVKTGD